MHIATTSRRVSDSSADGINDGIRRQMEMRIAYYSQRPERIDQRLGELDREWDVERALETGSSTLTLTGITMSILSHRKWLMLSLVVQGFFLQHALQGWCPPLPVLRRMGFRTAEEINRERYALKALRGDFQNVSTTRQGAVSAMDAVSEE